MVIVTTLDEKVYHFNIPNVFLNGEIHESVFMHQPPGFEDEKYPNYVCSLKRGLYGLHQASLAWYIQLDDVLTSIGLKKHTADPCFYYYYYSNKYTTLPWILFNQGSSPNGGVLWSVPTGDSKCSTFFLCDFQTPV